ncbi:MAG: sulfatase-like hydrolase/transferase [Planctomycetaceae bacterium]
MLPRSVARRSGFLFWIPVALLAVSATVARAQNEPAEAPPAAPSRPNILWITCEDMSPHLGCYGDRKAITPNLDKLAATGARYVNAFSVAGVCAPSRSCLITGMYPTSIGSEHMRSKAVLPALIKCFPQYLREAGYYCTNDSKTDYNFDHSPESWDESSPRAHWRKRKPGQPFFSVVNITCTHESQIRTEEPEFLKLTADLKPEQRQDPAKMELPPYYPDTPVVRRDWARYFELVTEMDRRAGEILKELEADGLTSNTIVFFFSDHGVGLPRAKRWLYDSGIRVPLIIRWPGQIKPETVSQRLVSFVDFGPTVLSLAGVKVPEHLQGKAFLGDQAGEPRTYIHAARDRMDERYDVIRAVRDVRYKYIRNYEPQRPYAQFLTYAEVGPTMKEFRRLSEGGQLNDQTKLFMRNRKPPEELYDLESDPHEIHNLARLPKYQDILDRMQKAHVEWMQQTIDTGLLPEPEMVSRAGKEGIYAVARKADNPLPLDRIHEVATFRVRGSAGIDKLVAALQDPDAAVRFWAVQRIGALDDDRPVRSRRRDQTSKENEESPASDTEKLQSEDAKARSASLDAARKGVVAALKDSSPSVRVAAASAICTLGDEATGLPVLIEHLKSPEEAVRILAADAIDDLGPKARPAHAALELAAKDSNQYVVRLVNHTLSVLAEKTKAVP